MAMPRRLPFEIWYLVRTAHREFVHDAGGVTAGAIAFYTAVALVPTVLLIISLVGHTLGHEETYQAMGRVLAQVLPGNTSAGVLRAIYGYSQSGRLLVNLVGALGLLWSAINLFGVVSMILTTIWVGRPERGFFAQRVVGLLALVVAGVLFAVNVVLTGGLAALRAAAAGGGPLADYLRVIGPVLPFLVSALLAALTFFLLYRFLPGGKVSTRAALVAAVPAALLWLLSRWAFSALVAGSSRYGHLYGPLAGGVVLLLWIYYSAYIMIFCAELGVAAQARYWPKVTRPAGTM